jgi:hypothetical protein
VRADDEAVKVFMTLGGGSVSLNTSSSHVILSEPSKQEAGILLGEFRRIQERWLIETLCLPNKKGTHLFGLSGNTSSQTVSGKSKKSFVPKAVSLAGIPDEIWSLLPGKTPAGGDRSMLLANAPLSTQERFMRAALGSGLDGALRRLRERHARVLVHPEFEDALTESADGAEFVRRVISMSAAERSFVSTPGKTGGRSQTETHKRPMPDLLLYFLSQRGVVLFPLGPKIIVGRAAGYGLADRLTDPGLSALWSAAGSALSGLDRKRKWRGAAERVFESLSACSTLRSASDASPEMFAFIRQRVSAGGFEGIFNTSHLLTAVYDFLRDSLGVPGLPPLPRAAKNEARPRRPRSADEDDPYMISMEIGSEFEWTQRSTTDPDSAGMFPSFLTVPYDGSDNANARVRHFAALFGRALREHKGVRVKGIISNHQRFLVWLAECPDMYQRHNGPLPHRADINDGDDVATSRCFRAWARRSCASASAANRCMAEVSAAFDSILRQSGNTSVKNPFDFAVDFFPDGPRKTRSHRPAVSRTLLAALRERNSRDGFALSRSDPRHLRKVLDPDTGRYTEIWFPGVAVMTELLLTLPLRSFQARFLDSGETDEHRVTFDDGPPSLVRNTAPCAVKGRREGVFYVFDDMSGAPSLGIHVNTNKTGADRDAGYEIPWCSRELTDALLLLLEWQTRHNPQPASIPCLDKPDFKSLKNPEIIAGVKRTVPLFRDPDDCDGWPVSREKLADHWNRLTAATEDELTAAGRTARLTEVKAWRGGDIVRRVSAYDIHTLRVSGITALIEAGMAPDLVQQVAGHSTVVMTLYYNKTRASALNSSIAAAIEKTADLLDDPSAAESDYDSLRARLFNTGDHSEALSMLDDLRGRGDGGVRVMFHGICPGADCSTGSRTGGPLTRPAACPLCRHRLTSPAFLPGLVQNANSLMHEMRRVGRDISALNEESRRIEDAGRRAGAVRSRVEALYIESDACASEWAAEVQYVKLAERLLAERPRDSGFPLVCGEAPDVEAKADSRPEFELLQTLAEAAGVLPGFHPAAAIDEHREFLNEILSASKAEPFLLRLRGDIRDRAAVLLGRAVTALVPSDDTASLRDGAASLADYPAVAAFIEGLRGQALAGALDESALPPLTDALVGHPAAVALITDSKEKSS